MPVLMNVVIKWLAIAVLEKTVIIISYIEQKLSDCSYRTVSGHI